MGQICNQPLKWPIRGVFEFTAGAFLHEQRYEIADPAGFEPGVLFADEGVDNAEPWRTGKPSNLAWHRPSGAVNKIGLVIVSIVDRAGPNPPPNSPAWPARSMSNVRLRMARGCSARVASTGCTTPI
jgi:hypothetical protein